MRRAQPFTVTEMPDLLAPRAGNDGIDRMGPTFGPIRPRGLPVASHVLVGRESCEVSEQNDAATGWLLAVPERSQDSWACERKLADKVVRRECENSPIVPSVGNEKDDYTALVVASLERNPACACLYVSEA